ncbi:zinc finger SWIM domain-containing protein 7-like [Mercenaria mercenaria]|uniref:zinc finger SWIM domain-containing protein 7-like n=1 Tax=Mercenaria mercenaria TaxID=6596 RepID=UPI001E1D7027|nr:zinc finger SWIM domain-containing protein 7-like [Mercenaria mercenaria]
MADTSKPGTECEKKVNINTKDSEATDVFEAVTGQLFEELKRVYQETGKVTDEVLSALSNVLQAPLLPALDLVDNRSVSLLVCPAGRQLYQVVGSSGTPYTCFKGNHYCSCPAYRFSILKKEEHTMCKHVLAVKLSDAMDVTKKLEVTDKELTDMLINLE